MTKAMKAAVDAAWAAFRADPSRFNRELVVKAYLPLVRVIAESIGVIDFGAFGFEDLVQAGAIAVNSAIDRYDHDNAAGASFASFIWRRIKGAMVDMMRDLDCASRTTRRCTGRIDAAREKLQERLKREPRPEELAEYLRVPIERLERMLEHRPARLVSLSRKWFETDTNKDVREIDMIRDDRCPDPFDAAAKKDAAQRILRKLPRDHRFVVELVDIEGVTMAEVGRAMGLSESRVSQLHSHAIEILRAELAPAAA